ESEPDQLPKHGQPGAVVSVADPGEECARERKDDHVEQEHHEEPDPALEMETGRRQFAPAGAVVVEDQQEPADHGDPADGWEDSAQALDDHLAEPAWILERPRKAVTDARHRRDCKVRGSEREGPAGDISRGRHRRPTTPFPQGRSSAHPLVEPADARVAPDEAQMRLW